MDMKLDNARNILYNDLNVLTKTVGLIGSQQRAGMVEAGAIMV